MLRSLFGQDQTEHIEGLESRVQELEAETSAKSTLVNKLETALVNAQQVLKHTQNNLQEWQNTALKYKQWNSSNISAKNECEERLARLNERIAQMQSDYDAKCGELDEFRSVSLREKKSNEEKMMADNDAVLQVHSALKNDHSALKNDHSALQKQHSALQKQHEKSSEHLAAVLAENAELKSKQEKLNAQIHLMMENMNKRNEAYESSRKDVEQSLKDAIQDKNNEIDSLRELVDAMKQENNKKIGIIAHLQTQCNALANAVAIPQALEVEETPRLGKRLRITP